MRAFLDQLATVIMLGIRTLPDRFGPSIMTVVGIAGVVAVLMVMLSIAVGIEDVVEVPAAQDTVVVLRVGSDNEMASSLDLEETRAISQAPGIRSEGGVPLLSAEVVVVVDVPKITTGTDAHIPLRGVQDTATRLREGFRIVEGRMFESGKRELIVGRAVAEQYQGLEVGSVKVWGDATWTIVGVFATLGSVTESDIWADLQVLQPLYGFGTSVHSVHARLTSPDALVEFTDALHKDIRTNVIVERYSTFFGRQSEALTSLLNTVGRLAGFLMGLCASFGALNTMYAAVAARQKEIATLRAIGFGALPTIVSVLAESMTVAAIGGLLGLGIAFAGFDGLKASTMNWDTYTQVAFTFQVDTALAVRGVGYALLIGLVGGLFPAVHAARLPVAAALREG